MTLRNSTSTYGGVTKLLHWLVFILVVVLLIVGFTVEDIGDKAIRSNILNVHKLTGLTVLFLMLLRALWALTNPKPALPSDTPHWQRIAERIVHVSLYLALIAMPVSGWVMTSAAGKPPHFFNWILALPVPQNKPLSDYAWLTHEVLSLVIIILVSIHVAAALYHFFIKKDNIMQRMLP